MKNVIFMGKTGCGKTTLCQKLNDLAIEYKKTQSVEIYKDSIDTPGEYMENRHFYNALIVTAADARLIALVVDPTSGYHAIPPSFAGIFQKQVIGIITKITLAEETQILKAEQELEKAGVKRIFKVDTPKDIGIGELSRYLEQEVG